MVEPNGTDAALRSGQGPSALCVSDELLGAYLSGEMSTVERTRVEDHLRDCDHCVELLPIVQRRIRAATDPLIAVPSPIREAARATATIPVVASMPKAPLPAPHTRPP